MNEDKEKELIEQHKTNMMYADIFAIKLGQQQIMNEIDELKKKIGELIKSR